MAFSANDNLKVILISDTTEQSKTKMPTEESNFMEQEKSVDPRTPDTEKSIVASTSNATPLSVISAESDDDVREIDYYTIESFPDPQSTLVEPQQVDVTVKAISFYGLTVEKKENNKRLEKGIDSHQDNNISVVVSVTSNATSGECFLSTHLVSLPVVEDTARCPIVKKKINHKVTKKHMLVLWGNNDEEIMNGLSNRSTDLEKNFLATRATFVTFSRLIDEPGLEDHRNRFPIFRSKTKIKQVEEISKKVFEPTQVELRVGIKNESSGEVLPVGVAKVLITKVPCDIDMIVPTKSDYYKSMEDLCKRKIRDTKCNKTKWDSLVSFVMENDTVYTSASFQGMKNTKYRLESDSCLRLRLKVTSTEKILFPAELKPDPDYSTTNCDDIKRDMNEASTLTPDAHEIDSVEMQASKDSVDNLEKIENGNECTDMTVPNESPDYIDESRDSNIIRSVRKLLPNISFPTVLKMKKDDHMLEERKDTCGEADTDKAEILRNENEFVSVTLPNIEEPNETELVLNIYGDQDISTPCFSQMRKSDTLPGVSNANLCEEIANTTAVTSANECVLIEETKLMDSFNKDDICDENLSAAECGDSKELECSNKNKVILVAEQQLIPDVAESIDGSQTQIDTERHQRGMSRDDGEHAPDDERDEKIESRCSEQSLWGLSNELHSMLLETGRHIYGFIGDPPNEDTTENMLTIMEIGEETASVFCCFSTAPQ